MITTKLGVLSRYLFFLLFIASLSDGLSSAGHGLSNESAAMKPVAVLGTLVLNETRRRLGSFQICALCTCCSGGPQGICLPSPCCYAINCHIPNRPFGFCSFAPKSCNCFGCNL